MTAPDFIEPLIGFRAWHLDDDGSLVPWSLQGAGAWQPGVNTAVCHAGKDHQPPATGCMCGLYALATACDHRLHGRDGQIVGAIAAWGDIELHRTGFRASTRRSWHSHDRDGRHEAAERAAARHEVPLVEFDELEVTVRGHGRPIDPSLLEEPTGPSLSAIAARPASRSSSTSGAASRRTNWSSASPTPSPGSSTTTPRSRCQPPMTRVEAGDPLATLDTPPRDAGRLGVRRAGSLVERNERVLRVRRGCSRSRAPAGWPASPRPLGRPTRATSAGAAAAQDLLRRPARADRPRRGRVRRPTRRAPLRRAAADGHDRHRRRAAPAPRAAALRVRGRRLRRLRRARARADRRLAQARRRLGMRSCATASPSPTPR